MFSPHAQTPTHTDRHTHASHPPHAPTHPALPTRCKQLMDALPAWAAGSSSLLKLLNQPWEGDVTMVLPVREAGREGAQ